MFIATFTIAPEGFALAHALGEVPEIDIEFERVAAHSTQWVMPCLWVAGDDFDAFDAALEADPSVDEIVSTREYTDEKYYQVDWSDELIQHVDTAIDREASILDAEVKNGEWHLRIRFVSRDQFRDFREYLSDQDLTYRLRTITETTTPRQEMGGLTGAQRDALVAAVHEGYFAIPREATLDEVADGLDISGQALSERLRRGVEQFVENALVTADEYGRDEE